MSKKIHQIIYAALIVNLLLILLFAVSDMSDKIICSISLLMMLILPIGKKGKGYHITVSTFGFISYLIFIYNLYCN